MEALWHWSRFRAESMSTDLSGRQVRRTEEDLPRWQGQVGLEGSFPFPADESLCLGLALVLDIDISQQDDQFSRQDQSCMSLESREKDVVSHS